MDRAHYGVSVWPGTHSCASNWYKTNPFLLFETNKACNRLLLCRVLLATGWVTCATCQRWFLRALRLPSLKFKSGSTSCSRRPLHNLTRMTWPWSATVFRDTSLLDPLRPLHHHHLAGNSGDDMQLQGSQHVDAIGAYQQQSMVARPWAGPRCGPTTYCSASMLPRIVHFQHYRTSPVPPEAVLSYDLRQGGFTQPPRSDCSAVLCCGRLQGCAAANPSV